MRFNNSRGVAVFVGLLICLWSAGVQAQDATLQAPTGTVRVHVESENGFVGIDQTNPKSLLTLGASAPTSPAIGTGTAKLWVAGNAANPAVVTGAGAVISMFTGGGLYDINNTGGSDVSAMMFRGGDASGSKSRLLFLGDSSVKNSSVYNIVDVPGTSGHLAFDTAPNASGLVERMRITSAGRVGIGTTAPTTAFHVVGDATFDGTVTGTNIQAKYQDVAEWVPAAAPVAPGTVVVLNPEINNNVIASSRAYDTSVAGVVSPQPGLILGEPGPSKAMIATTGRVKVRVDASRGPIRIGDLLVTGDKPGTAMKSEPLMVSGIAMHRPGTLIGKALEPLKEGVGEILVLLSLQ